MNLNEKIVLYPAMKNTIKGKIYGYINNKGLFVIKPRFKIAYDFKYGVAIVSENNKFGAIDDNGEYIVKPIYDNIREFKEKRAVVNLNGDIKVIDNKGNVITRNDYDYIGDFNNGLALVAKSYENNEYRYGYIDLNGEEVIPIKFLMGYDFKDNVGLIKLDNKKYALINKKGEILNTYNHEIIYGYNEKIMIFADNSDGPYGYINSKGVEIIKAIYSEVTAFKDGVVVVSYDKDYRKHYGLIDKEGKYIFQPIFSNILNLGEGMIALGMPLGDGNFISRNIYAIGDIDGKIFTDFIYLNVGDYKEGLAYVSDEEYTFFIDKKGKERESFPKVKGSGELLQKGSLIYANIDYMPYYIGKYNSIVYSPNNIIKLDNNYSVFIKKYKPNIDYLCYIPNISSSKNEKIEEKINEKLEKDSYFHPYSENKDEKITKDDVLKYYYYGDFDINFFKNNFISLNINGSYYELGAAHPIPVRITENINLKTGNFYALEDLFVENYPWKNYLNTLIKDMIELDKSYDYVFKDSFKGINNNKNFYIDENNLYIYFKPYDIAPYVAGFVTFKIPFESLNRIINKDGEFYLSFK